MFGLKAITTEADVRLLNTAETLLKKHADPYLDIMGVFVRTRQLIKVQPDRQEEVERIMEEYFRRSGTAKSRDPNNPGHKGRFNAALGDLRNFRASILQRLQRGDPPRYAPSRLEPRCPWPSVNP